MKKYDYKIDVSKGSYALYLKKRATGFVEHRGLLNLK